MMNQACEKTLNYRVETLFKTCGKTSLKM